MKKKLLLGILGFLCLVVPAQAQLQKGTKYVAATISFNGRHSDNQYDAGSSFKTNTVSIFPSMQFGKFIRENRMIGLGLGANLIFIRTKNQSSSQSYDSGLNSFAYAVSPYIRHYKPLSAKWALFLNSSVNLTYNHYKNFDDQDSKKQDGYSAGIQLTPGISYWITPRFAVESDLNFLSLAAGYQHLPGARNIYFNSAVTSNLTSYFSVRASWYLQKP
jgi:hypothetical protein